ESRRKSPVDAAELFIHYAFKNEISAEHDPGVPQGAQRCKVHGHARFHSPRAPPEQASAFNIRAKGRVFPRHWRIRGNGIDMSRKNQGAAATSSLQHTIYVRPIRVVPA